jgi:hypothetical protein
MFEAALEEEAKFFRKEVNKMKEEVDSLIDEQLQLLIVEGIDIEQYKKSLQVYKKFPCSVY